MMRVYSRSDVWCPGICASDSYHLVANLILLRTSRLIASTNQRVRKIQQATAP